jgi:hypothetical protein
MGTNGKEPGDAGARRDARAGRPRRQLDVHTAGGRQLTRRAHVGGPPQSSAVRRRIKRENEGLAVLGSRTAQTSRGSIPVSTPGSNLVSVKGKQRNWSNRSTLVSLRRAPSAPLLSSRRFVRLSLTYRSYWASLIQARAVAETRLPLAVRWRPCGLRST